MPHLARAILASAVLALSACSGADPAAPAMTEEEASIHRAEVEGRHAQRIAALTRSDGWLSLVGLHWFEAGEQRIGSAADNAIVLATGPDYLADVILDGEDVRIDPLPDGGAWHEAASAERSARLRFNEGAASIEVIERGGRYGLRVRDAASPVLTGFSGIERFGTDPAWRFNAEYQPHDPPRTIPIVDVLGNTIETPNPGSVSFKVGRTSYSLEALEASNGRLFLVFADRTSGKQTYGAGRFLYADAPANGRTVLDFNLAYNPPCAFTEFSTCQLPPPENRLDLAVQAGEMRYLPAN